MDIQQAVFTQLKIDIEAKGYDTHDGHLPPKDTPYPFVYLGNSNQSDNSTKAGNIGTVSQMIHVWHNDVQKRGTVSAMLADIKDVCRELERKYPVILSGMTQDILPDNTTKQPLLHGVLTVNFKF
jgi:hypothetical protein